jgi:glycine/D-amino acid oxidase-like deaminating enzyme
MTTLTALPKVRISPERIVRRIVGLRPFRPGGFVVRVERLDDKLLVHDYGHGGGGVTLSWGTAHLAADALGDAGDRKVAVLGGGAVGLAAARVLQERGRQVTIYARALSPETTSDVAGARFYPSDAYDAAVATPAFVESLWTAVRRSYQAFTSLPVAEFGVMRYPTYCCRDAPIPHDSPLAFDSPMAAMLPGLRDLDTAEHRFPHRHVRSFESLFVETGTYLPALQRRFEASGGRVVQRDFKELRQLMALPEGVLVNCTGLGAASLFGDDTLYPIKGQLTILQPQPEVAYIALPPDLYMFPRSDGILLGGTFEHHVSTLTPNLAAEDRILAAHARFFAALDA